MKPFIATCLLLTFASCSTNRTIVESTLKKNQVLVVHDTSPANEERRHDFKVISTKKGARAIVSLQSTQLRIEISTNDKIATTKTIMFGEDIDLDSSDSYRLANENAYRKEIAAIDSGKTIIDLDDETNLKSIPRPEISKIGSHYYILNSLHYHQDRAFLQTLTIPFKYRPRLSGRSSELSTSFNVGFAYGWMREWTRATPIYRSSDNKMTGYNKRNIAFAVAPLIGFTAVSLKPDNTDGGLLEDRTILGATFGATAAIKFNTLNLGGACGVDFGLNNKYKWVYQGKPWFGLIIGIDLIK